MPTSWIDYGRGISGFRTLKMPITRRVLWRGGSRRVAKQPYRGKRGPQTSSKCSLLMTCKRLKQFMRFSALLTARAEPAKRGMLVVVGPQNVWNTIHQAGTTISLWPTQPKPYRNPLPSASLRNSLSMNPARGGYRTGIPRPSHFRFATAASNLKTVPKLSRISAFQRSPTFTKWH